MYMYIYIYTYIHTHAYIPTSAAAAVDGHLAVREPRISRTVCFAFPSGRRIIIRIRIITIVAFMILVIILVK